MATKGGYNKGRKSKDSPDVRLSKFLSFICRHGAQRVGLKMADGGFVNVSELLALPRGRGFVEEDIRRVVANCPKQRFLLREVEGGPLMIRANQGHSLEVTDLELVPVESADEVPTVVHGTHRKAWETIKVQGLSKMKRTHIHFAAGLPGESGVVSGMRSNCKVLIFINLEKAVEDGLKFYRSANNVILCPGNEQGILLPHYFDKVVEC